MILRPDKRRITLGSLSLAYDQLRAWYLARLRRAAIQEAANLTPVRLIKADKEVLETLIAQKSRYAPVLTDTQPAGQGLLLGAFLLWLTGVAAVAILAARSEGSSIAWPAAAAAIWSAGLAVLVHKGLTKPLAFLLERLKLTLPGSFSFTGQGRSVTGSVHRLILDLSEQLEEAVEREIAIFDFAGEVVASVDSQGRFLAVNPTSFRLWSYVPDELLERPVIDLIVSEDKEKTTSALDKARVSKSPVSFESRLRTKPGIVIDMGWSAEWSETDGLFFLVGRDVTAEQVLNRLRQEYIAMVSHDLRSPLTAIYGQLRLLASAQLGELPDRAFQSVKTAERNAERLLELASDLLDVERLEAGKLDVQIEEIDLEPIVHEAAAAIRPHAHQRQLKIQVTAQSTTVMADRRRTLQVLMNLLSNAVKFSPAGSAVSIVVEKGPSHTTIKVSDSGPGIPIQYQETIFERFRQFRPVKSQSESGSGLGLTICRGIVQQQGGSIGVASQPEAGSTFWFTVPQAR